MNPPRRRGRFCNVWPMLWGPRGQAEPKVIAFLEALSRCGMVAEAARMGG